MTDFRKKYGRLSGDAGREEARGGAGGGLLLLCAVSALCLAVLAMLAMSSAASHKAVSDACLAETDGYYRACLEADRELARRRQDRETGLFHGTYGISGSQELLVEFEVFPDGSYEVHVWSPVPSGGWEEDTSLEVIQ